MKRPLSAPLLAPRLTSTTSLLRQPHRYFNEISQVWSDKGSIGTNHLTFSSTYGTHYNLVSLPSGRPALNFTTGGTVAKTTGGIVGITELNSRTFTINFWMNFRQSMTLFQVGARGESPTTNILTFFMDSGTQMVLMDYSESQGVTQLYASWNGEVVSGVSGTVASLKDTWIMVTVVKNNTMAWFYLNGVDATTQPSNPYQDLYPYTNSTFYLGGASVPTGTENFQGLIATFSWFDYPMTPAQVASLYACTKSDFPAAPPPAPLPPPSPPLMDGQGK